MNAALLGSRALGSALADTTGLRERSDEARLRYLLHAAELIAERVAICVASASSEPAREYAEWTAPLYRRAMVSMDDIVAMCEGLRATLPIVLTPAEMPAAESALDAAIEVYRWHRRLAGDARKKNPLLQAIYKGG